MFAGAPRSGASAWCAIDSAVANAIDVVGLTKRFGDTVAVQDLSFSVAAGRVVGFLGPNGAGKTTTLRALLGLIRPSDGHATIEGRRYEQLKDPFGAVGALLDGGMLHPGRKGRNHLRTLARATGVGDARVDELLELVELKADGGRRTKGYSLGMRQRLGLAAALHGDPRVLVLDEPANGLDPQGIRWLRDFLRGLAAEGRAVLVSSHVLTEVAQTADEVVVIHRGRSVVQAPLAELMAQRTGGVRVAGPDVARLGELLRGEGAAVQAEQGGAILVGDRSGEQIGRVIAAHGVVISELAPVAQSLEQIFFELTDGGESGGPS
jgi:ABC-2 type transport system ATP-binding protein